MTANDEANSPQTRDLALAHRVAAMMSAAWRAPGFCVPNTDVYPHQWLWDSCFHALIWADLADFADRAETAEAAEAVGVAEVRASQELSSALANQASSGFVPHMTYWSDPGADASFWGTIGTSTITQPPMYGHTLAQLLRRGGFGNSDRHQRQDLGHGGFEDLAEKAISGLIHLLEDRLRSPAGLVCVFHPWESGCDDSPRWPGANMAARRWVDGGRGLWRQHKGAMVADLVLDGATPTGSSRFVVGSVGFSALVAWNALELVDAVEHSVLGASKSIGQLAASAGGLVAAIADRWDGSAQTWVDDPVVVADVPDQDVLAAAQVKTSDALLALLVDPRPDGLSQLVEPAAFGGRYGPTGVDRREASFDPATYWRGPAWPQMSYLLSLAARRAGRPDVYQQLAASLASGATTSGFAEYWNPDTGEAYGAVPQTWAALGMLADQ